MAGTAPAPRRTKSPLSRLRLAVALAAIVTAVGAFALVEALHASPRPAATMTIQSAGFAAPTDSSPVGFSLPVLQRATPAPSRVRSSVTMSSLVGHPLVLNLWSSSCSVCTSETPAIESVARRTGRAVKFVGIDTADQRGDALAFLRRFHVSYLQLFDPGETVGEGYAIMGLPVTVFVSAHGDVVGEYFGGLNARTLTHYLHTLLGVRPRGA
jgi:thiol-disulfide isomerase/thioredoxin